MPPLLADGPRWIDRLRGFAHAGVNFIYPPTCPACQAETTDAEQSAAGGLCEKCRDALTKTHGRSCLRCGAAIGPHLDPTAACQYCRDDKFAFERVIRLGVYDDELRGACLRSKQRHTESLAAGLAMLLLQCESESLREVNASAIVPVPQHWVQRLYRPHNTAEVLATVLSRRLHVPVASHIVKKTRWTPPQSRLNPTDRRTNLRGAFAANRADLTGSTALVVDDVMTTGTTAHEVSKVLRKAGAERVIVAVIARGLGRRDF